MSGSYDINSSEHTFFMLANEYLDFLNFLEEDLGLFDYRDTLLRFYASRGEDEQVAKLKEQWDWED